MAWKSWPFQYFHFETNFLKNKNLFRQTVIKLLVESTKIESALFAYKTALSEANVKTNWMGSTKWTYYNEWSFASIFFFFFEILLQCKNLLRVDLMYNYPNVHIHTFRKHWSSIWGCFSLWVSLKQIEIFSHLQQN